MEENKKSCYLCGNDTMRTMFTDGKYSVCRCSYCSMVETFPKLPPGEINNIYNKRYFNSDDAKNFGYLDYLGQKDNLLQTFRMRLRFLDEVLHFDRNKKVLEIGFAYGFFLSVCEENKFLDLTGVDIARVGWEYAKDHLKQSKVILGSIEDVKNETFDYIFLWDTIEHVCDPKRVISNCYELLNDGGYLILETQNVDSLAAKLLGRKWWHYKYLEHLYHFNKNTIGAIVEEANFKVVNIASKASGKYLSKDSIVERLNRLHPVLSKAFLFVPIKRLYVNFYDEIIAIYQKK